jgi:hypothetical protein
MQNIMKCPVYKYKIYSLTHLSIKQLFLKYILHHISQLHVSAHFYGAIHNLLNLLYFLQLNLFRFITCSFNLNTCCIF